MAAIYTFDVVCTLDGFGSYSAGDWGGCWSRQGPEYLAHRFGPDAAGISPANRLMRDMPATVVEHVAGPGRLAGRDDRER